MWGSEIFPGLEKDLRIVSGHGLPGNTDILLPETALGLSSTHKYRIPVCLQSPASDVANTAFCDLLNSTFMSVVQRVCCKQRLATSRAPQGSRNVDSPHLTADLFLDFPGAPLLCTSKLLPLDSHTAAGRSSGPPAEGLDDEFSHMTGKQEVCRQALQRLHRSGAACCGYIDDVSHQCECCHRLFSVFTVHTEAVL